MPQNINTSLYDLLEVGVNASTEEITASYQRIVAYMAPDALAVYSMLEEEEALLLRRQLDDAYETLSDPDKRAAYDRRRAAGDGYPAVLVPAHEQDASVTMGVVGTDSRAASTREAPLPQSSSGLDVDAIFLAGGAAPEPPSEEGRESPLSAEGAGFRTPAGISDAAAQEIAGDVARRARQEEEQAEAERREQERRVPLQSPAQPLREARPTRPSSSPLAAVREPLRSRPPSTGALGSGRPPHGGAPANTSRRLTPNPSIEVTAETEYSGALLRRLRESCPADLDTVAEITKIRKHYLAAIEEHDFGALPAAVYVRGFVTEYARVLGLDIQRVAQSYMSLYKRYRGEGG